MRRLAELELEFPGPTVMHRGTKVWLNGLDITTCVRSIELNAGVGDVTTAKIEVLVGDARIRGDRVKTEVRDLLADWDPNEAIWKVWVKGT